MFSSEPTKILTQLSHGTKFHLHYSIYEYSKILTLKNFPGTRMNIEHESVCLDKIKNYPHSQRIKTRMWGQ